MRDLSRAGTHVSPCADLYAGINPFKAAPMKGFRTGKTFQFVKLDVSSIART